MFRPQSLQHVGSVVVVCGSRACRLQYLWHTGSVFVAHGLCCSAACGIFLDQGSNPRPLHWQADSSPLCHQGSPLPSFLRMFLTKAELETAISLSGV